jgi:membrane dipeptidase
MLIDAHLDLAFNALAMGADLTLPLADLRDSRYGRESSARGETPTVSLPAMREGGVRVAFGTIFVQSDTQAFHMVGPTYHTQGWAQMRFYRALAEAGEIALVIDRVSLANALAGDSPLPGIVPLMEGADPIRDIAELPSWVAAGLRVIGPAWTRTRYSGGTGAPGPLTPLGRELLREMDRLGLALDVSHLSDESFWEALDLFRGPLIASHANCRALVPTDRHLSDDMIRAVIDRDGVIGVVLYNRFLDPTWKPDQGKSVRLESLVRHIEHICAIAGDARHVGIGSDLDGGFGREAIPAEIDSILDLHRIGDALRAAGWRDEAIAGVLGGNWARWLRPALPEGRV